MGCRTPAVAGRVPGLGRQVSDKPRGRQPRGVWARRSGLPGLWGFGGRAGCVEGRGLRWIFEEPVTAGLRAPGLRALGAPGADDWRFLCGLGAGWGKAMSLPARGRGRYPRSPARDAPWQCSCLEVRLNLPPILKKRRSRYQSGRAARRRKIPRERFRPLTQLCENDVKTIF